MSSYDTGDYFVGPQGTIFIQPDGPNTKPEWLGCHDLGDIAAPGGDITRRHCVDKDGNFVPKIRAQGPSGEITTSITTYSPKTADWLELQGNCRMPLYIHQSECGPRDLFAAYERGQLLAWAIITSEGETGLVVRETADAAEMSFDVSAKYREKYWKLLLTALVTAEAAAANDIVVSNSHRCYGGCGGALDKCTTLFNCNDAVALAIANVDVSVDGGTTWASVVGPFVADENIISGVAFPISETVDRWIVVRSADAGVNPLEVAYSDDHGANWNLVVVGAVASEEAVWGGAMFAIDARHIWLGTGDNNIYFSSDAGLTWALQDTLTSPINMIHFIDEHYGLAVGDANDIEYTEDGGVHWAAVVGPSAGDNLMCCAVIDQDHWWVGNVDGELWYTVDQGANWVQRFFDLPPGVVVITAMGLNDMDWIDEFCGHFVLRCTIGGTDYGLIYRTVNGGFSWEYQQSAAFDGAETYNAVLACDYNKAYTVGGLIGAVTGIDTVAP